MAGAVTKLANDHDCIPPEALQAGAETLCCLSLVDAADEKGDGKETIDLMWPLEERSAVAVTKAAQQSMEAFREALAWLLRKAKGEDDDGEGEAKA